MMINLKRQKNKIKGNAGFTLVEMMVALALFVTVMFVAVGSLTSVVLASKKVQSISIVMDNLNFALENVTRSLRTGFKYHCGSLAPLNTPLDCLLPFGSNYIAFQDVDGGTSIFRLDNKHIQRSKDGGSSFVDITAPEIEIDTLLFYVEGSLIGDGKQPRVLIIIEGTAGVRAQERANFSVQTTISQRMISS